ncbi:MAG: murein L,D-transpeptidase [Rhodoferax sp.]|nr:murein L,D-transpeptidase [Rhodoferax sp.]
MTPFLLTRRAGLAALLLCTLATLRAQGTAPGAATSLQAWSQQFASEVDHRLDIPTAAQQPYLALLQQALDKAKVEDQTPQAYVLVDRNPNVQAAFIVVRTGDASLHLLGATAVSTGKPGSYEHFVTPLGVFAHSLDNPDFRAEGTFNENRIRGYGLKGLRVFDFGWQDAERGWGEGGTSSMRLQMHATDPTVLEGRLGSIQSEGCVRIPTRLNRFLDSHGVLDRDYEAALAAGDKLWLVQPGRPLIPWPGRYLVVVDSEAAQRPPWSPLPRSQVPAVKKQKPARS